MPSTAKHVFDMIGALGDTTSGKNHEKLDGKELPAMCNTNTWQNWSMFRLRSELL